MKSLFFIVCLYYIGHFNVLCTCVETENGSDSDPTIYYKISPITGNTKEGSVQCLTSGYWSNINIAICDSLPSITCEKRCFLSESDKNLVDIKPIALNDKITDFSCKDKAKKPNAAKAVCKDDSYFILFQDTSGSAVTNLICEEDKRCEAKAADENHLFAVQGSGFGEEGKVTCTDALYEPNLINLECIDENEFAKYEEVECTLAKCKAVLENNYFIGETDAGTSGTVFCTDPTKKPNPEKILCAKQADEQLGFNEINSLICEDKSCAKVEVQDAGNEQKFTIEEADLYKEGKVTCTVKNYEPKLKKLLCIDQNKFKDQDEVQCAEICVLTDDQKNAGVIVNDIFFSEHTNVLCKDFNKKPNYGKVNCNLVENVLKFQYKASDYTNAVDVDLNCIAVFCPKKTDDDKGYSIPITEFGKKAKAICDKEEQIPTTTDEFLCGADGEFKNVPQSIKCELFCPKLKINYGKSLDDTIVGNKVKMECEKGYEPSKKQASCLSSGKWDVKSDVCEKSMAFSMFRVSVFVVLVSVFVSM